MLHKIVPTLLITLWLLSGCSSMQVYKTPLSEHVALKKEKIAVIPFYNYTQTPMAGYSAASIAGTILKARGFRAEPQNLQPDNNALLDENRLALQKSIAQLQHSGYRYVLNGEVTEWRYKSGIDAEPVVGLVVNITDTRNGKIVYTATGTQNALSTASLSSVAQTVLGKLLP